MDSKIFIKKTDFFHWLFRHNHVNYNQYFYWESENEERSFSNIYFDEIEEKLGVFCYDKMVEDYYARIKRATNKHEVIKKELEKKDILNILEKDGYMAKSVGDNMLFSSILYGSYNEKNISDLDEEASDLKEDTLDLNKDAPDLDEDASDLYDVSSVSNEDAELHEDTPDWDKYEDQIDQVYFIAVGIAFAKYERFLNDEIGPLLSSKDDIKPLLSSVAKPLTGPIQKIEWNSGAALFGFMMNSNIEAGHMQRPTSSYEKDAEYYLTIYDIDTTPGTLAKELSPTSNSLTIAKRREIKIPRKDQL